MKRKKIGSIGVLAGGPSNERDISLRSGRAVYSALIGEGLDAIFLDVRDDICDIIKKNKIDVAFIALHGRFGEDGTVQKMLEEALIPYTGSGVEASRLAMDKIAAKEAFKKNGIPTPEYIVLEKGDSGKGWGGITKFPVVVKPQFEGSSIGLSVISREDDLNAAAEKAFGYGDRIIVEEHISGRELTVGILEDRPLPVIEIVAKNKIYDYSAKYEDPQTRYIVPAPIEKKTYERARRLGSAAHNLLGCRCFSRVDMMLAEDNDIYILEVNTIPGMTERSLLPKAAGRIGLTFAGLCVKMVEDALSWSRIRKEAQR